jgi:hypothetical protein
MQVERKDGKFFKKVNHLNAQTLLDIDELEREVKEHQKHSQSSSELDVDA